MIFRWLTQRKSEGVIGLDFGSDSLKLLKIDSSITPFTVENFSTVSLPTNIINKGEIKDYSPIADILKNLIRQSGVTTKDVAFAIPRSATIIKNITIDKRMNREEIESRAWIEANRHFPDLVGDIYLDFSIQGPSAQDPSQLELILVACRKDQIKPYLEILRLTGLNPLIVDVNSFALERALSIIANTSPQIKTSALFNLDFNLSTLIVSNDHKLIYAHDQSFDGHRLINQARDNLKDKESDTVDSVAQVDMLKETLSAHLRHTMHFFYSSIPNISIGQIVLSGDCAIIPNLPLFIQQEIGIETVVANPFVNMTLTSMVDETELKKNAPAMMLCCGLALSRSPT